MHAQPTATQRVFALRQGSMETLDLPAASRTIGLRDLRWGRADEPLTPAYWAAQTWMWQLDAPEHYRLGRTLAEELLACMLGGHGISAEIGLAAYDRLREHFVAGGTLTDDDRVEELLAAPLAIDGRMVRYRFARQKARYVAAAFRELDAIEDDLSDLALRDRLVALKGVGPKTASWVVRNLRGSDRVAILDVHILRACRHLGIFDEGGSVARNYAGLEAAYLAFARAIGVRASLLDSVMWMTMRQLGDRGAAAPIGKAPGARFRRARGSDQHELRL